MAVKEQAVRQAVAIPGNPGVENLRAKPDVVIVWV
jgi:hypothetical protein